VIIAAPSPWAARATISAESLHASPDRSEAAPKTIRPTTNRRRLPTMSAVRPPRRRKPPKKSA
jgi:hypothetical protein